MLPGVVPGLVVVNVVNVVLVAGVAARVIVFAVAVSGLFLFLVLLLWLLLLLLQHLAGCSLARGLAWRSGCLTASPPVASGGTGGNVWISTPLSLRCSVAGDRRNRERCVDIKPPLPPRQVSDGQTSLLSLLLLLCSCYC